MSLVAGLTSGSGIISGIGSLIGGSQRAAAYQQAATQANQTLQNSYNQVRTDESPYTSAGSTAINTLSNDLQNGTGFAKSFNMSDFYNDPGYQFTLQQGTNAINNSAAAKGGLLSGAATKGLTSYATGLANQTYGDSYNRYLQTQQQGYNELAGVAGMGQTATTQVNNAGVQLGEQQASNTFKGITGAGDATAAGIEGFGNDIAGSMGTLGQYYAKQNAKPSSTAAAKA